MHKQKNIKKFLIIQVALSVMALILPLQIFAQETVAESSFTPYSLFGIGDLVKQGTAYNRSMGGIGIGDRNNRFINYLNPAAVTARDTLSFLLDFGIEQKNTYYSAMPASAIVSSSTDKLTSANNICNMHHIIATFPIYKKSAFKIGITPFSDVGYKFISSETDKEIISEIGDIKYQRVGQGGIYQTFIGAGATFFDRLSVGADVMYYFGTINRYSSAYFTTNSAYRTIKSGWTYVARGFSGKFGFQYEQPLSSTLSMTIGGTYKLASNLGGDISRYAYGISTNETDTISYDKKDMTTLTIPQEIGIGITLRKTDKWMVGFDYTRQDWSNTTFEETPGVDFSPVLAQSFKAGFEFTPNRYDVRYYSKSITYRGGAYYDQSYFSLNGNQINSMGVTFGVSLPIFRWYNSLTIGVDIGQRGTLKNNMIREQYFLFTLALNLHDIWFIKPLYN